MAAAARRRQGSARKNPRIALKRESHNLAGAAALASAIFFAVGAGCANKASVSAPLAPEPAPVVAAPSSALVFESPFVRARHGEHDALALETRPEFDRRGSSISARSVYPVLGTRQWPEPARPDEGRVPVIWSRWGRSF